MSERSRLPARTRSSVQALLAAALALAIFVVDAIPAVQVAVTVLYVLVVLLSASVCSRRGVLLVGGGCVVLTVAGFLISDGPPYATPAILQSLVSITEIAITTLLVVRGQAATVALRRNEAYLNEAQRLSQTGSFGWNVATRTLVWSAETYRILEYGIEVEPTVEAMLDRVHPDDKALLRQAFDAFDRGEASIDISHRLLMPDGTVKHLRAVARARRGEGNGLEYVGALSDVTATRQAEHALLQAQAELAHVARIATLSELTTSIAHEVNQPLAAIVTNGEAGLRWLDRGMPQLEEIRGAMARIISEGRRASEIVRRLRHLARKAAPQPETLAVSQVINDVLPLIGRELEMHGISLRLALAPGLPFIRGDRVQLQQVVINLLINAIQAMEPVTDRPRELVVMSGPFEDGMLKVEVRDSGVGIAAGDAERLFQAFYTTKKEGMGVGLSICRSIIEAHGGRIWAAPHEGPGALLTFTLPVVADQRG
jgi:signal transduction histidine kinase